MSFSKYSTCYFIILYLLTSFAALAQPTSSRWKAIHDDEFNFLYFTDEQGQKHDIIDTNQIINARYWDQIIAIQEIDNSPYRQYYLNKQGISFGIDSVYFEDNTPDCEQEGFIRFHDRITDQMGLFDAEGKVILPAHYNYISQVNNGWVITLSDAKKKYYHKGHEGGCQHYSWEDGVYHLYHLQDQTQLLLEEPQSSIDLYHYFTSTHPITDSTYISALSSEGIYYHFKDHAKDFSQWLNGLLHEGWDLTTLYNVCLDSLLIDEGESWKMCDKSSYLSTNASIIQVQLELLKRPDTDYFISQYGVNPFLFESSYYDQFLNNCNQPLVDKYPTFTIVINQKVNNSLSQNHFEFLKTDWGYKLIQIVLRQTDISDN